MPIFEYICRKCKRRFEVLVSNKREEIACPSCGGEGERIFSVFGFSSKGKFVSSTGPSCSNCSTKNCNSCN
ncbi:MAG TPA: zinc ribbon domain-containing protein [Terriglobales bacterium]|nr:zinc ribbon domain-containing protein [Terriglobales bacterium]